MATPDPRAISVAIFEDGWNRGAFEGLADAFAPTFTFHVHGTARGMRLDDLRWIVGRWRDGFPDLRFELHDVLAQGDRVAIRATLTGTHLGTWSERPASGRAIAVDHMFVLRFDAGRVVEVWEVLDSGALRRQLDGAT